MRALLNKFIHSVLTRSTSHAFCQRYNVVQKMTSRPKKCTYVDGLYFLEDGGRVLYFTRPLRYRYYSEGIYARLENLFLQYTGGKVEIRPDDVVIDCGANIGEFSKYCEDKGAVCISFEPDPVEYRALVKNLSSKSQAISKALWKENVDLHFNLANDTGDSSVVETGSSRGTAKIEGVRLDSLEVVTQQRVIRLMKLEAEGYEFEVLQGVGRLLERIEYIAADLGPERGVEQACSLPDVVNYLTSRGFELLRYDPSRSIIFFRNRYPV